jgi:hypothetical protein
MEPGEYGWKMGEALLRFALTTPAAFNLDEERVDYTLRATFTTHMAGLAPTVHYEEIYRAGDPTIDIELALLASWNYNHITAGTEVSLTASAMLLDFAQNSIRPVRVVLVGADPTAPLLSFTRAGIQPAALAAAQTPEPQAWQLVALAGVPLALSSLHRRWRGRSS